MKNMKISKKFVVTFGVILLLFCVTVGTAIFSLNSVRGNFTRFYNAPYQNTTQIQNMQIAIQSAAKYVGYATMSEDLAETKKNIDLAQAQLAILKSGTDYLNTHFTGDKTLISNFLDTMNASTVAKEKVFTNASTNNNEVAIDAYFNEYQPYLLKAQTHLDEIFKASDAIATTLYSSANSSANSAFILLSICGILTFASTLILAIYLTRSLTRPIIEIETAANQIVEGNLNAEIAYESKDELGGLAHKMKALVARIKAIISDEDRLLGAMADGNFTIRTTIEDQYVGDFNALLQSMRKINRSLSETLIQINQSSEQVASGSDQVSSGAQALSQGATEQASSIEELSATINEISEQVRVNAENAKLARGLSQEAGDEVAIGNDHMKDMIAAMSEITNTSNEIGKIIKTIDDIAFQTNILALNAAVEAARAGEAGKGFAVVADEVGNLAQKSAEAAKSTTALIESAITAIGNGTNIASDTAKSLDAIVTKVTDVNDRVRKIAEASSEQAASISQVTQGIDQISSVVQTNSATAEESAAASEELSGQSQMLKDLVSRFKLNSGNSR